MMTGTIKGYQVGEKCFTDKADATNHVMSQVVPVVSPNGKLIYHPIYKGDHWEIDNFRVQLNFPECNPMEQFEDGLILGIEIIALMFIAFVIKTAIKLFKFAGDSRDEED